MKTMYLSNIRTAKLKLLSILFLLLTSTSGIAGFFANEDFPQNIHSEMPVNNLPSEDYFNANLRAGWDDDGGPGGSGDGDNTGVGVPIGEGYFALAFAVLIYSGFVILRNKNKHKIKIEETKL